MQAQYFSYNNVGENIAFKKIFKQERLGIVFEFTAQGTPQQSGYIKKLLHGSTQYTPCSMVVILIPIYKNTY